MSRPLYETAANRRDEDSAISLLANQGYSVARLGLLSPGDFIISCNDYSALVEFKRRSNPHDQYDTVIMPEQKLRKCLCLAEEMAIDFLYLVQFTDGLFITKVDHYHTSMGGRTDRGDSKDIHKVAHISKENFWRIQ